MSWVFLTGIYAWKMKKPLCCDSYLDFSTLKKREYFCREEVRLNRRLASDVYLGVVPVVKDAQGRFRVGGQGEAAEWLVKMKQLPVDATLRFKLENGSLSGCDVEAVAAKLIDFFAKVERIEMLPHDYIKKFESAIDYNFSILLEGTCDTGRVRELEELRRRQISFLKCGKALLEGRVLDGKIVEGHGDLRPEHIYLLMPQPIIIDCIEFNRDLRLLDVADEFSFLQMMCASFGNEDAGRRIFDVYRMETGDRPHEDLLSFYAGFRAVTRARLALRHIQDIPDADPVKWQNKLQKFLELARMYAERKGKNF